jgi:cell division septal protein FtsQ
MVSTSQFIAGDHLSIMFITWTPSSLAAIYFSSLNFLYFPHCDVSILGNQVVTSQFMINLRQSVSSATQLVCMYVCVCVCVCARVRIFAFVCK